jgi:putative SOS response-associated peptidase YedK
MCARYELVDLLRFRDSARFQMVDAALWGVDRLDIRPTQIVPVIVSTAASTAASTRDLVPMRWGLVPYWATDIRMGTKAINARAEGIADKPFFRGPLRRSRCLIPASAFFEWRLEGDRKVKYRFAHRDDYLFCFAGLYDTWRDPRDVDGRELRSCTIITTTPNDLVAPYHNRMPVILDSRDEDAWLDPQTRDSATITALLRPFPADSMCVRAA